MAQPPDDPFWDTLDDVTPAVPVRASPRHRAPQAAGPIAPISVITEPDYTKQAPQVADRSQPEEGPPVPLGADPDSSSPHLVTSSLRVPADLPTPGGDLRTTFSNQAVMIADLVRERLAQRSYGPAFYRLRIDEPSGPSTAGGLLARQPLSLVPRMDSAPVLVCGWVDVYKKDAQLRSYEVVMRRLLSRQGGSLPITEEAYNRFLQELMDTLFDGGIRILVLVPDEQEAAPSSQLPAPPPPRRFRSFLGAVFFVGLGFALGLNAERLVPWLEQGTLWLTQQAPVWLEWAKRLISRA